MILLDTNVISALMNDPADRAVVDWLNRQPKASIWTTAVTVLEIESGLKVIPSGERRDGLTRVFQSILAEIGHRITTFGYEASQHAAGLIASRQKIGRVIDIRDAMIAGVVLTHNAVLATRDVTHFVNIGARVVNPWAT